MNHQLFGSTAFWIAVVTVVIAYYGWVGYRFFRNPVLSFFSGATSFKTSTPAGISVDELAFSLSIQRKLMLDNRAVLDLHEQELLKRSPFKELISSSIKS
ncbi:hypothetical protein [Algoriphagus resistens]|uniref:hypothetical protein n=1 Tax=Algoriphagus resistens TaxID=1750590 RepID=UPI000716B720|nr:hypothetical protein [Algoriphagus resistens]